MFETWVRAKKGTPQGKRPLVAVLALAVLGLVAAGCGGGGDSGGESESAARMKLEAGATKVSGADSMRLSLGFEAEEDGESEPLGCIDLAVDTAKPESIDLLFFDQSCEGGTEAHELIAIGRRAWGSTGPGSWREAKITPALLHELADEQTDFGQLMAVAEDIEATPEGDAVEEPGGKLVDITSYSFEAPASAFPGADPDLGDLKVEFEATLDRHGYLRELRFHGDEDGVGATVTAKYEDINEPQHIEAPSPAEVQGPVSPIRTREELDALFGLPGS
jgi:hypothetical protein